jgi:hypothetical protein
MSGDWRDWRPAIWLAMLGIALLLLVNPPYIGAVLLGAAIGAAVRIGQRRRRRAASGASASDRRDVRDASTPDKSTRAAGGRPRKRRR